MQSARLSADFVIRPFLDSVILVIQWFPNPTSLFLPRQAQCLDLSPFVYLPWKVLGICYLKSAGWQPSCRHCFSASALSRRCSGKFVRWGRFFQWQACAPPLLSVRWHSNSTDDEAIALFHVHRGKLLIAVWYVGNQCFQCLHGIRNLPRTQLPEQATLHTDDIAFWLHGQSRQHNLVKRLSYFLVWKPKK